jgi:tRNA (cmo5U34)-methyltransferase
MDTGTLEGAESTIASKVVDNTMPNGRWEFNAEVTDAFDDMLERSIPQYEVMRQACTDLAVRSAKQGTDIVDLGCSRGGAIADLIRRLGAWNHFIGIDVSEPMLEAAQRRFSGMIEAGVVDIKRLDLRREYPICRASVTMAVLTIQFTPIEHRQRILKSVFDHTVDGGAFIMVEKVIGATSAIDADMVDIYHQQKREHGYSQDQIERKRLSLEGVLVPVTAKWNEELLRIAGFREVDCFWRWMNFAGWLARKVV